jgi:hypothetical protein
LLVARQRIDGWTVHDTRSGLDIVRGIANKMECECIIADVVKTVRQITREAKLKPKPAKILPFARAFVRRDSFKRDKK